MKRVVYGDIHGQFGLVRLMKNRHRDADEIIICGDVGIGFSKKREEEFLAYLKQENHPRLRFIRGNHDNLEEMKATFGEYLIEDGTVEDGVLYVGGAWSIDKAMRTIGYDWWEDEELSPKQWEQIFQNLDPESIHTVVSHDGPPEVTKFLVNRLFPTVTGYHLSLLREKLPNLRRWIFGHYHVPFNRVIDGVHYVCLPDDGHTHVELHDSAD